MGGALVIGPRCGRSTPLRVRENQPIGVARALARRRTEV